MCEQNCNRQSLAKVVGIKGVISITPFSENQGIFFVESTDIANYLHEKRIILVSEKIEVKVYKWNLNVNASLLGLFRKGWIKVKGLPFHLWSEKHLFCLVEGWGKVLKIDRHTTKLVDLAKIWIKVEMKERAIIPNIVRVLDEE